MIEEIWSDIPGYSNYLVSNFGRFHNIKRDRPMSISFQNTGHAKISLLDDYGQRHSKSAALLVAEAFVQPPTSYSDHVILLDGNYQNVAAWNLAWRPRGFAFQYSAQLQIRPPALYILVPVRNISHPAEYESIVAAGRTEGLIFDDIWRSTWTGDRIFPYRSIFKVIH